MIGTLLQAGFGGIGQDCILQYFFAFLVRLIKSLKSEIFLAKNEEKITTKTEFNFLTEASIQTKSNHSQNQSTKFGHNYTPEFGKNGS